QSADSCSCHAMLPRAGFSDDALLAHAHSQERLAKAVIDLMRTGMEQVLTLEIDLCSAQLFGQAAGVKQRGRTPGILPKQALKLQAKLFVLACLGILLL